MFNKYLGEYLDKAIVALSDFATCTEQFIANCESSQCIPLHPADIAKMKFIEEIETEKKPENTTKLENPKVTSSATKQKQTILDQSSFLPSENKEKTEKNPLNGEPKKKFEKSKPAEPVKSDQKENDTVSTEPAQKEGEHTSQRRKHRHRKQE